MATYTNGVQVNTATESKILQSTDTLALSNLTVSTSLDVTGAALTGFNGITFVSGTTALTLACGAGTLGDVTFDGTSAVTGFTLASRVYTCSTAGCYDYRTLTIDTSGGNVGIITKGITLQAITCTCTGSGTITIYWDGAAASGGSLGAGAAIVTNARFAGGTNGANGRTGNGSGTNGTGQSNGVSIGGAGGNSGAAGINSAGSGGSLTRNWTPPSIYGDAASLLFNRFALAPGTTTFSLPYVLSGGAGGGGGAGSIAAAVGGGGGGGGGVVGAYFATLNLGTATMVIRGAGGAGANGAGASGNTTSGGGGGGGGGGVLVVLGYISGTGQVSVNVDGGAGGNAQIFGVGSLAGNGGSGGDGGFALLLYGGKSSTTPTPTGSAVGGTAGTGINGGVSGSNGVTGGAYILTV